MHTNNPLIALIDILVRPGEAYILLKALNALVDKGNHVVIIEHNSEIIKSADWVIDIGPEGGKKGGEIVFEGTPENLIQCKKSYSLEYLKNKL